MPVDIFIKIDGIKGESKDSKHPDEVDVLAWNWGMSSQGAGPGGGGTSGGKVSMQDLTIGKFVDAATPALMLSCASGRRLKSAMLTLRASPARPYEMVRMKLEDVLVSSVAANAVGTENRPTETVSLRFARVHLEYTSQKPNGMPGQSIAFGWDLTKNSKW